MNFQGIYQAPEIKKDTKQNKKIHTLVYNERKTEKDGENVCVNVSAWNVKNNSGKSISKRSSLP